MICSEVWQQVYVRVVLWTIALNWQIFDLIKKLQSTLYLKADCVLRRMSFGGCKKFNAPKFYPLAGPNLWSSSLLCQLLLPRGNIG